MTKRIAQDRYMTPLWCVRRLVEHWSPRTGKAAEPAVGTGNIIRAINRPDIAWTTYDIEPLAGRDCLPTVYEFKQCDFLTLATYDFDVHTVITNPPYSMAEEFLRRSRMLYPSADIVMLFRLSFLASEERLPLWRDIGTPNVYVLPNRPSFTGKGTDSADYAWLHFRPMSIQGEGDIVILRDTPLAERKADGSQ